MTGTGARARVPAPPIPHIPDRHAGPAVEPFRTPADFTDFAAQTLGRPLPGNDSNAKARLSWLDTPLGVIIVAASPDAILLMEFAERRLLPRALARLDGSFRLAEGTTPATDLMQAELDRYFAGRLTRFTTPLRPLGTPFSHAVWQQIEQVPYGKSITYADLAARAGHPTATRAAARANGANPIAIAIPCHRICAANGALTGYGGGLWRKHALRDLEAAHG